MKWRFIKKNKYQNPFLPKRNKLDIDRQRRKKRIFLISLIFFILIGLIYFILYASLWRIKKISISGTQKTEIITEIRLAVQKNKSGLYFGLIPKDNILFFNVRTLEKKINDDIVLERLEIKKKLFSSLEIMVKEKLPVLIWNEKNNYYYIDKAGVVMGARKFEELKFDLPFINYGTTTQIIVGRKIMTEMDIEFIQRLLVKFKKIFKEIQIIQTVIDKKSKNIFYFYTNQGWYFILKLNSNVEVSINNLKRLLEQKIDNVNNLEYVDLRIEDRIFYKLR